MTDDRPSIAELQRVVAPMNADATGVDIGTVLDELQALVDAAPVLLEIAAAALALRDQERKADRATCAAAAAPLSGNSPNWDAAGAENDRLRKCLSAYHAALAKVRP